jgi:uncharacterized protein YndB with AHSA1/START domain
MTTQLPATSVTTGVDVDAPAEHAFRVFTEGIDTWWPLKTHSTGEDRAESVHIEPRVGGLVVETMQGGETSEWGSVLAWDPFDRLAIEWRVNPEKPATEIEISFTPDGDGTVVRLEHRYWERHGEKAAEERAGYSAGWERVLGAFQEAIGAS